MTKQPKAQGINSNPVHTIHLLDDNLSERESRYGVDREPERVRRSEPGNDNQQAIPRGKLKIFFSFAPGTGKTLTMLKDAQRRKQDGADVVIGFVDAHGEMLALQILETFEILPQVIITGDGFSYRGMNLNRLLERRPQLVLVDHLAQLNPPGLRHDKRYLEVEELLDAGIDVYTTLNIYQLESQVDTVAYLTGINVRETVPDRFLDLAEQLELVDLPPQELLQRYRSGLVFVPARAAEKMGSLFQPGNLFSLRELALRYVAQRSNRLLRSYLPQKRVQSRGAGEPSLLVCISDHPNSARLVRAGRRMADETRAEWTVLYVETPDQAEMSGDRQEVVTRHLRLAELLGARTETLSGRTLAEVVSNYAQKKHITQVLVGQPERTRWNIRLSRSLAEQIQAGDSTLSVFVVGSDQIPRLFQPPRLWSWISRMHLFASLLLIVLPTILGLILTPTVISRSANVVMLYLVSVVIASIFLGTFPAILTAVFSVLVYDFFFIPPIYKVFNFAPENAITFASLLVVSLIINTLVTRERALTKSALRQADQVTHLYELSRDLASAVSMPDILNTVIHHVRHTFERETVILLPKSGDLVLNAIGAGQKLQSGELTAAEWAFQQGRPSGYNTGTFSNASFRFFPLESSRGITGVLGVRLAGGPDLHPEQVRLLSVYVTKAALAIERGMLAEEVSQTEIFRATEKPQPALLNSISHDLRTPLASITGVLSSLRMEEDFLNRSTRQELVETALGEAERLNRLVANLLDMTRLESGTIKITPQPCDIQDVIGSALNILANQLEDHPVEIDIPGDLPLAGADYVLVQQVVVNLLENAAKYSSETGQISIGMRREADQLTISIGDSGPGVPPEDLERIFEKFYRVKRFENVVGTGLGLSICKGIVEVHGGKIWAENNPEGGLVLNFTLPVWSSAKNEQEPEAHEIPEEVET